MKETLVVLLALAVPSQRSFPGSTVMLSKGDTLLVGHNFAAGFSTPGMFVVKPRGVPKRAICGKEAQGKTLETPVLRWKSRYASITFDFGLGMADGGMNEVGLVVNGIELGPTQFAYDERLPTMLARQWIQYQLDSFATTAEVLKNLSAINIDGTSFDGTPGANTSAHFFVTDRKGEMAIIEFLNGAPLAHTGDEVPIPVLCNLPYDQELKLIKEYWGFGGFRPVRLEQDGRTPRFVQGARLCEIFHEEEVEDPLVFCFEMLLTMQRSATLRWRILYDVKDRRIYLRAGQAPFNQYLDFDSVDLSSTKVLRDIRPDLRGDLAEHLVSCTNELNREFIWRLTSADTAERVIWASEMIFLTDEATDADTRYFEQPLVSYLPAVFAPGILSLPGYVGSITFTPDGGEIFFASGKWLRSSTVMQVVHEGEEWSTVQPAPYSGQYRDGSPCLSPDGKMMFFASDRPHERGDDPILDQDLWFVDRTKNGWTEPRRLGPEVNTWHRESSPSVTADGVLYFTRWEGGESNIYRCPLREAQGPRAVALPPPVTTDGYENSSWISPDERLLLFSRWGSLGGLGGFDVFVSHRSAEGEWSRPKNLGSRVNTPSNENCARLSPGGGFLFFNSTRRYGQGPSELFDGSSNFYWVRRSAISAMESE